MEIYTTESYERSEARWPTLAGHHPHYGPPPSLSRVRIGAVPMRARTTRARHQDRSCRAGCGLPNTNNYVLQICPRTHSVRIARYNSSQLHYQDPTTPGIHVVYRAQYANRTKGLRKPQISSLSWGYWEWWLTPRLPTNSVILKELGDSGSKNA